MIKMIKTHLPLQLHISASRNVENLRFNFRKNYGSGIKPKGGFWTSSFIKDDFFKSHWQKKLFESQWFDWNGKKFLVYPNKPIRIFVIDDFEDIVWLEKHGYSDDISWTIENHDNTSNKFNWNLISKDFDGLNVTIRMAYKFMIGWDVESTVWFKRAFKIKPY